VDISFAITSLPFSMVIPFMTDQSDVGQRNDSEAEMIVDR
jgi:hypothetical protein